MPVPLIIGIAAGVIAAGGVVAGGVGMKDSHKARNAVDEAKREYESRLDSHDYWREKAETSLSEFATLELKATGDFDRLASVVTALKNPPVFESASSRGYDLPEMSIIEAKTISLNAVEVLGALAGGAGAGVAAGAAAYGGVSIAGAASTGTLISSLSGVAAQDATLAALGGGAISAGGGGMTLGIAVLGGAVGAAAVGAVGVAAAIKGAKDKKRSSEIIDEYEKINNQLYAVALYLKHLYDASEKMKQAYESVYSLYLRKIVELERLAERKPNYNQFTDDEKLLLENNILLIRMLYKISNCKISIEDEKNAAVNTEKVESIVAESRAIINAVNNG